MYAICLFPYKSACVVRQFFFFYPSQPIYFYYASAGLFSLPTSFCIVEKKARLPTAKIEYTHEIRAVFLVSDGLICF